MKTSREQRETNISKLKNLYNLVENEIGYLGTQQLNFILDSANDYQELIDNYSKLYEEHEQLKKEHEQLKSDILPIQTANAEMYKLLNPQAYKEEELHRGMIVFDDETKELMEIDFISRINKGEFLCNLFGDGQKLNCFYSPNRFFPVTKALEYQG